MNILAVGDAVTSGIAWTGKCIPTNDMLANPVSGPLELLVGAVWGLWPWLLGAIVVFLILLAGINAMNERAPKYLKGIALALAIGIVAWIGLMIYFVITGNMPDVPECPF